MNRSVRKALALLVILLPGLGRAADPGSVESASWKAAPLVQQAPDGSMGPAAKDAPELMFAGFPAFQKLSISKADPDRPEDQRWIVSGVLVSTNAGGTMEGVPVYIAYEEGGWMLVAISNLKGEVLFTITGLGKGRALPKYLYVTNYVSPKPLPAPGFVARQYPVKVETPKGK